MKNKIKIPLFLINLFLLTNLPSFGLVGGGSLTLTNNTNYSIYLRQVPIVAIWAYSTDLTDPVEFSDYDPVPPKSTSQPATWSIYSVGVQTTTNLLPSLICTLGFITKDDRIEIDIDLAKTSHIIQVDGCMFTIDTDLLDYNYTWPTPSRCFQSYENVKLTVTQNNTCKWENKINK